MAYDWQYTTQEAVDMLRDRLELSVDQPPDNMMDLYFKTYSAKYSDNSGAASAAVGYYLVTKLMSAAAKRVDYTANTSSFKGSQYLTNLEKLLKIYKDELDTALTSGEVLVMWGNLRQTPANIKEYPNDILVWDGKYPVGEEVPWWY